ncbi:MAG: hypothetical protein ACXWG1_12990 [Usitatibacter sp.]
MTTPRIERMLRELDCDPSHQFFSALFGIIGLGKPQPAQAAQAAQPASIPHSLLANSPAR